MPTYKNVSGRNVDLGGKVLTPNEEVASLIYYNENEVGLLKTDEKPWFNPVLFSGQIRDVDSEILVPEKDNLGNPVGKFSIHFYVEEGDVEIFYNSPENKPSLKLYEGARWNTRLFERRINKLLIRKCGSDKFTLWIQMEKVY